MRTPFIKSSKSLSYFLLLLFCYQTPAAKKAVAQTAEQHAAQVFATVRDNPLALHAFLAQMPKGADLHSHLSGAVYAESYIRQAAEDKMCIDLAAQTLLPSSQTGCEASTIPAEKALQDQALYDTLINAFSMRNFIASSGVTGHDHFFASFDKFDDVSTAHAGEWLNEVASRAAAQNEQYLEIMQTGKFNRTKAIAKKLVWSADFTSLRNQILAEDISGDVSDFITRLNQYEQQRQALGHCNEASASPACQVTVRYLYQILRGFPKEQVFAQALLGFEIASRDPRVVGINLVMPEDGMISMQDYALQMQMIGFLHSVYPQVHISLHAGEISPGSVPPNELCCHVRLAVEVAHAERIGHGVDVLYEDRPYQLLKEMAAKHVLIETNLTSNEVILGIAGKQHPFPIERQLAVPLALSTDDEGVSRINLTNEFSRAVKTYDLNYFDLKQLVRASLEHSFLPGISLWQSADVFTASIAACAKESLGSDAPSTGCAAALTASEKARQQWELEKRFRLFEKNL